MSALTASAQHERQIVETTPLTRAALTNDTPAGFFASVTSGGTAVAPITNLYAGTVTLGTITTNGSYTIQQSDAFTVILLNVTNTTTTLPSAVGIAGRIYTFKNLANSPAALATQSSQRIDATSSTPAYTMAGQYNAVTVMSDGVQWWAISKF